MRNIYRHEDNAYVCGALLALEATGAREFMVVDAVARRRKKLIGGELDKNSLTRIYIGGHFSEDDGLHGEDAHYQGMLKSFEEHINPGNIHRFIKGFFAVLLELNMWWERIADETYYQMIRRGPLAVRDSQVFDATRRFQRN
jgi:hypothetical protein